MKKRILIPLLAVLGLVGMKAGTYSLKNLPVPYLKNKSQYVSNPDGLLSASAVSRMNELLQRLEQEKGVQTLVVAVDRVEGGDCYEFAITLGNHLKVGNRNNTGLIILLAAQDRCYQILTGEGLEGALPDAICRRIENRQMVPYLKSGDWDAALTHTVEAVCGTLLRDETLMPPPASSFKANKDLYTPALIFLSLVIVFLTLSWYQNRRKNACPRCGKHHVKRTGSTVSRKLRNGFVRYTDTYRCPDCGHTYSRHRDEPTDHGTGFGGFYPPMRGGMFGGRPFGGGFGGGIGGSFGGGSFGGGGSGGRF